jgi:hypothetical protein
MEYSEILKVGSFECWVGKNCQFIFQLLQTELEPGLIFRTRTGIGLYVLRTGSGIEYLKLLMSGTRTQIHSFGIKVTITWG